MSQKRPRHAPVRKLAQIFHVHSVEIAQEVLHVTKNDIHTLTSVRLFQNDLGTFDFADSDQEVLLVRTQLQEVNLDEIVKDMSTPKRQKNDSGLERLTPAGSS